MREDLLRHLPRSIDAGVTAPAGASPPKRPDGVPPLRSAVRTSLALADKFWWRLSQRLVREKPSLVNVALHSLCSTRSQTDDPTVAPNQNVSVADFRNLVDTVLEAGYTVVSPTQIVAGLDAGGKFVMFTFDDGYFNNVLALDVLEQYQIPATFFISSNHVLEGKAFWWDALNRALVKAGATEHQRNVEIAGVKTLAADRIDAYLQSRFGVHSMRPEGDSDRPFTRQELANFARHPCVHLGNHTCDHAILTLCSREEMQRQIKDCQDALTAIAGYAPVAISYPNGNHSAGVIEAACAAGLRIGVTVRPCHNRLPLREADGLMKLGRFYFYGDNQPRDELLKWRAGFIPSNFIKRALKKAH